MVYSIFGAVWFTDPNVLLPLVRNQMRSGGVFVFSHPPASEAGVVAGRAVSKWNYPADQWVQMLAAVGFSATADVVAPPDDQQVGTLVVRATAE